MGGGLDSLALANNVLWRRPAVSPRDKDVEPVSEVLDVGVDAEECLPIDTWVEDAREASVDWVDVDDVARIEDRVRVGLDAVRLQRVALLVDIEGDRARAVLRCARATTGVPSSVYRLSGLEGLHARQSTT